MSNHADLMLSRLATEFDYSNVMIRMYKAWLWREDELHNLIAEYLYRSWIPNATGWLLDRAGLIVGMPRLMEEDTSNMFTYKSDVAIPEPGDVTLGYKQIGPPELPGGYWSSIHGDWTQTPIEDDLYREWIYLKIKYADSGATIPDIYNWILESPYGISSTLVPLDPKVLEIQIPALITHSKIAVINEFMPKVAGHEYVITRMGGA